MPWLFISIVCSYLRLGFVDIQSSKMLRLFILLSYWIEPTSKTLCDPIVGRILEE